MDEIIAKFAEERETLAALKDHGEVEKQHLHNEMSELENDLAEASEHLQTALREASMWEDKCKLQAQEITALRTKHASDLAREEAEKQELRSQISNLRDNSKLGAAQRQAEEAEKRGKELSQQLSVAQAEVQKLLAERKELESRLSTAEEHIDDAVSERIAAERSRAKTLEAALQSLKDSHADETKHWDSTQKERDELVRENDELKNWKAVYEAGHGLQQLARNQKKLTDDNRRLTQALEQRTTQYSALMDAHAALSMAFERLQKETGRTVQVDLTSPDLAEEVKNTASGLQLQIRELEDQLNALEEDNSRLRKQLRAQMGTMTEGGFKYPGLAPEQLVKVNEFAANLRDGKMELPLDDRSRSLMTENKQLKKDIASLNATLLKLERDGGKRSSSSAETLNGGSDALTDGGILSDAFGTDIKTLLQENAAMQAALQEIKARLEESANTVNAHSDGGTVTVAHSSGKNSNFGAAELARILAHNNEMILKELDALRRSQSVQMALPPSQSSFVGRENSGLDSGSSSQPMTARRPPLAHAQSRLTLPQVGQQPQQRSTAESPFPWTPFGGRSSTQGHRASHFHTPLRMPQTPVHQLSSASGNHLGPQTPFGKTLLADAVQPLNLPPEEWAGEVKDLYAQLVQCLEQLFERDVELDQTRGFVRSYESQLGDMKLQMTILYHDFAQRSRQWKEKEKTQQQDKQTLVDEIEDLRLKVRRLQEMNLLYQKEDEQALQNKLSELTRRAMIFEVNEAVLSRKYISATESLSLEQKRRADLQADFVEMEASLKERILFLEHFKETATQQLSRLQTKLDNMVPAEDFNAALAELASLREDHLHTLRSHAEVSSSSLSALDAARELRSLRLVLGESRHEAERLKAQIQSLQSQLLAQAEATKRAALAAHSSAEVATLVTELARYKGETSRLDFELQAQNKRVASLTESLSEVLEETETLTKRVKELQDREESLLKQESAARNQLVAMQLKYQQGLTRDDADVLRLKLEAAEEAVKRSEMECKRQKELADIATNQAAQSRHFQSSFETELKELREYCAKLESRGDDEVIIGRLQRELLSTKSSYRAFARKYQVAREGIRHREVALRLIEGKLLSETQSRHNDVTRYQQSLSALSAAMETLKTSVLQIDFLPPAAGASSAPDKSHHLSQHYKRTSYVTFPVGAKVAEVSTKLDSFSVQAQDAVARAQLKEDDARRLQNDFEDLSAEKSSLTRRLQDLDHLLSQSPAKQQALAARIIALSEENRLTKIAALQSRRQVSQLREEMKHLRHTIGQLESEVVALERAKVEAESQALRQRQTLSQSLSDPMQLFDSDNANDNTALDPLAIIPFFTSSAQQAPLQRLSIDTEHLDDLEDADEQDKRLRQAKEELSRANKELSALSNRQAQLSEDAAQLSAAVEEKDAQVAYYEKLLRDQGLGGMLLRPGLATPQSARRAQSPHRSHEGSMLSAQEQAQMQAAATATISSLKQLLEEKNRTIESYREKVERLLAEGFGQHKSRATQRADDLLDDLSRLPSSARGQSPDRHSHGLQQTQTALQKQLEETNQRLTAQLEAAEAIVADKDSLVSQLEQKLAAQTNQRERAELRCAEGLEEMEAMKMDMVTLLRQLQESEARCAALQRTGRVEILPAPVAPAPTADAAAVQSSAEDHRALLDLQKKHNAMAKRLKEAEKMLRTKEDKVRGYRDIIVRLKDEFVKSEEERAVAEIAMKQQSAGGVGSGVSADELRHMRDKVAALSDGLKATKADLDAARKTRDKLQKDKQDAQDALEKAEDKSKKAEQQAVHAQNVAARYRKELEEARKKEVRMREKLKEFVGGATLGETDAGKAGGKKDSLHKLKERLEAMERDNELLRAQLALYQRQDHKQSKDAKDATDGASHAPHSEQALAAVAMGKSDALHGTQRSATGGYLLGHGDQPLPADDLRAQLASRWEAEKTMQQRLAKMEKRLGELTQENSELRDQVARHSAAAQAQSPQRPGSNRRGAQSAAVSAVGVASETKSAGPRSATDMFELDAARRRVFELEAELSVARRKADVDLAAQVRQLQHQLSTATHQLRAAEAELVQYEERRKKEGAGGGLRASEDRYLREERLRDELDFARRQRLELEAQLLERDAQTLELRFESEEKAAERLRLQRRVKEQEEALKLFRDGATQGHDLPFSRLAASGVPSGTGTGTASRREAELEAVVESMKRVVEKLRGDNERLRRGIGGPLSGAGPAAPTSPPRATTNAPAGVASQGSGNQGELEKKLAAERRKTDKLAEELAALRTKVAEKDESQARLSQKTQQVSTLQKKLQKKEEEFARQLQDNSRLVAEKEALAKRVSQLEAQLQTLPHNKAGLSTFEEEEVLRQLAGMQAENDSLRLEVGDLRRKLSTAAAASNSAAVASRGGPAAGAGAVELDRLREENAKLKSELAAFDLDFFEEIENLKFAHAEAVRKLKAYESGGR